MAVLLAFVRVTWVWPLLLLLGGWMAPSYPQPVLPLWSLMALLLGGRIVAHMALTRSETLYRARLWVALIGLGTLLTLLWWHYGRAAGPAWEVGWIRDAAVGMAGWQRELPPAVVATVAAVGLWLRGVVDAREAPRHATVLGAFVTGSGAFVAILLAGMVVPAGHPPGAQSWLVTFVVAGMAALALASIERAQYAGHGDAPASLRLNRYWLASVGAVIVAILALGLLLAAIVAPGAVAEILGWLSPVGEVLARVLAIFLYIVAYLIFLVLAPLIAWLRDRIAEMRALEGNNGRIAGEPLTLPTLEEIFAVPAQLVEPLRWAAVLVILAAITLLFALALQYLRPTNEEDPEETRESIFTTSLLRDQWNALLNRIRRRFAGSAAESVFLALDREEAGRRRVRALYQAFLGAMIARAQPRAPGQTPDRYRTSVNALPPVKQAALDALTEGYVAARYGGAAPSAEEVARSAAAWQVLAEEEPDAGSEQGPEP